jgi:hypothetical protein
MTDNTPYSNLKSAIEKLEKEQAASRQALQDQFKATYDKLNPFTFVKNAINSFTGSPEIRSNLFAILIPLATTFIGKKAFAGNRRSNAFSQFGILFIDGLNRYISSNPEILNTISHFVFRFFHRKKSPEPQEE